MKKIFCLTLIAAILSTMVFYLPTAMSAKEDTAQLTFKKTAVHNKTYYHYTIQKNDVLSAIIRKIPGIQEQDIPQYYRMIKELNPHIKDLDKLEAGQKIVLPAKLKTGGAQTYRVKKGDYLIGIVHRELHITANTQKTMLLIKSLNPSVKDANKLYIGQVIRLPKGRLDGTAAQQTAQPAKIIERDAPVVSLPEKQQVQEEATPAGKEAVMLPPAERLAVLKHIITQMNGTMITRGNYYLPVSKTAQLTIDCSVIPVVELDDRTTLFLDMKNRSGIYLKTIISGQWGNYHVVKIDAKDDMIMILKKIFKNSKAYAITRAEKPVGIGSTPVLEIMPDWLITKKNAKQTPAAIQGLRFVYRDNDLLPRAIINFARRQSFMITEISPSTGLVGKPDELYSLPAMTVLPASPAGEFAQALLSYLNVPFEKDVEVRVFSIRQDGFNLSIKADLAVKQGDQKTLLFSRNLPPQFVNILQKTGDKLIFISDQDEPAKNMEKILRGFNVVFTSGYFSFSGLDKNQPPYTLGFKGIKIKTDKDIYAVNFDFHHELRGLMQETWSANIIRY
ncbi:MAG: LysM peptidoglycan-binding domain-containing protein [Smithellaceae bacterium]|nr:LysM peptidoglycan-binding domain-containing protein [Smithellaceae bacterium]